MTVIFDLDLTLVDTQIAQPFRDNRDWNSVYKLIPTMQPYADIDDIIHFLNLNNVKIVIVTKAPRPYCQKIINQWNWQIDDIVCFHDVAKRKPYPDSIIKAMSLVNAEACDVISIGDVGDDITASKRAGVYAIGATWGCLDLQNLKDSHPDMIVNSVAELKEFLKTRFNI